MKKLIIILAVFYVFGCAHTCPTEMIYMFSTSPWGGSIPVEIPKGFFDDPDNYLTEEEWNVFLQADPDEDKTIGEIIEENLKDSKDECGEDCL